MPQDFPQDLEERIRRRAYRIWEQEGRPEGRADSHWELASEEIAIEDNIGQTLKRNPARGPDDTASHTEPVEPALSAVNTGDQPGLEDQGQQNYRFPGTDRAIPPPPGGGGSR